MADSDQDRKLTVLTDEERASLQRWLEFPEELPKKFWAGMVERASLDRAQIPVGLFSGITQFRPVTVRGDVTGFQATSYTDLGLDPIKKSKGRYMVTFGWTYPRNDASGTEEIYMQPRLDNETLDDANALVSVRRVSASDGATQWAQYSYKSSFRVITIPEQGGTIRLWAKATSATHWNINGIWMQVIEVGAA